MDTRSAPDLAPSVLFISLSVLACEIVCMRLLSYIQWYHFAYMVISIALLGFAASGTFLAWKRDAVASSPVAYYRVCACAYPASLLASFWLLQKIPFDPFFLIWDLTQLVYLCGYCLLLCIPFFLGACCIGIAFMAPGVSIPRLYCVNMLGSGLGAPVVLLIMMVVPLKGVLACVAALGVSGALLAGKVRGEAGAHSRTVLYLLMMGSAFLLLLSPIRISPHKQLSKYLLMPGIEVVAQQFSPLGQIHVLGGPLIRIFPGLSIRYAEQLPEQLAILLDGELLGPITRRDGLPGSLEVLNRTIQALPYCLLREPQVLILGAGGGMDVLRALTHDARKVVAVEQSPQILRLVQDRFSDVAGNLYHDARVEIHAGEARGFVRNEIRHFDLIDLASLGSAVSGLTGVHSLAENYLYTVESFKGLWDHLENDGLLAVSFWLRIPPREMLKLCATCINVLAHSGVASPGDHLVVGRGVSTAIIILARSPLDGEAREKLKRFCEDRAFDLIYYPGIDDSPVVKHTIEDGQWDLVGLRELMGTNPEKFVASYPFYIEPATDDNPYFHRFFRWRSLSEMLARMGRDWLPYVEWGYLVLVVTLCLVAFPGILFVMLPLYFIRGGSAEGPESRNRSRSYPTLVYFCALGGGFMVFEMAYLQRFTLFLALPLYAASVVLSSILVFSSLGSLVCLRIRARIPLICILVSLLGMGCFWASGCLFDWACGVSLPLRILLSVVFLAVPSFAMGMPFPLALSKVKGRDPTYVPLCWGINGWSSVVSTVLTPLLAMHIGLRCTFLVGVSLYLVAGVAWRVRGQWTGNYT